MEEQVGKRKRVEEPDQPTQFDIPAPQKRRLQYLLKIDPRTGNSQLICGFCIYAAICEISLTFFKRLSLVLISNDQSSVQLTPSRVTLHGSRKRDALVPVSISIKYAVA